MARARSTTSGPRRAIGMAVCAALVLVACGRAVEPRTSAGDARTDAAPARIFDSPRETTAVEADPEIGALEFSGRIEAQAPIVVVAAVDGVILDVLAESGSRVDAGDPIVTFLPTPPRSEALAREILDLEAELAAELGDADEAARVQQELAALDELQAARATSIEATTGGVVTGLRPGLRLRVDAGDELFATSEPDDIVVIVSIPERSVEQVAVGDPVEVRLRTVGANAASGTVIARQPTVADLVDLVIGLDDPTSFELGDSVEARLLADPGDGVWITTQALHRRSSGSFLLIERSDGSVERVEATFGRRTDTHIEVLGRAADTLAPGTILVLP